MLGQLTVPDEDFVVYAVGTDASGQAFQRVRPAQFSPQAFSIVAPVAVGMGRGQDTTYIFQVKNEGAANSFNFSALDNKKYQTGLTPSSASIPTGGSVNVNVVLHPPSTAAVGTADTLTFTAAQADNPDANNYAVLNSNVVDAVLPGDGNRDGVVNCDDFALVKVAFGSKAGDAAFNPALDANADGLVDEQDLPTIEGPDTEPPIIKSLVVTPDVLSPANHKMVAVSVEASATDWCSIPPPVCKIVSVSSNEPADGKGDGNTEVDWEIDGELSMQLRAERSGQDNDRIYTATIQCSDAAGNNSSGIVNVTVPHDSKAR